LPCNKVTYPRPKLDQSERDKYVANLINRLRDLERRTDPKDGVQSAKGKNLAALKALEIAGDLVNALAGWALDHQAGLALKDLKSVPLRTAKPPEDPDRSKVRLTDDDHRHEWYGRNWVGRLGTGFDIDPIVGRKWLINLVRANPGIFNLELMLMTMSALEACDYNEIHPMLKVTKKRRKVNWTILQLQRRAILHVKDLQARGFKKLKALEEVAGTFGVSVDTVRSWEQRLRAELGAFAVKANNNDSPAQQRGLSLYDPAGLQKLAQQYMAAVANKRIKRASIL
jgi:hypothetical protein